MLAAVCALCFALFAPAALAAQEIPDAGDLPTTAQYPGPPGPLNSIGGMVSSPTDADMYKLCLTGDDDFSATTVGTGGSLDDSQLFLFDSSGRGVYANDDSQFTRRSTLPANNTLKPGVVYYLAITAWDLDPASSSGWIFPASSSGVGGPTGNGGADPVSGWSSRSNNLSPGGSYTIQLSGAKSCDEKPPLIDLRSPPDDEVYDLNEQVTADYGCADEDGGSGIASCTGDVPDGANVDTSTPGSKSFTVTATDKAGNQSSVTHSYTVVADKSPPAIDLRTPADGDEYDLDEQVAADYSCADEPGGSGMASCTGTVADGAAVNTSSLGTKSFTVEAEDKQGNHSAVTHTYEVVDRTDPTVDLRTPAEGAVYARGEQIAADYSCADEDGGSGIASCTGDVPDGANIDTSTLGNKSFTVTAKDKAGNESSASHGYTVVDKSAPGIDLRTPADGAVYGLDDQVAADYSCADEDGGSGIASCTGDVPDGAALDTSNFGSHSFTVNASDNAGNTAVKTVTYHVQFAFEGFFGLDEGVNVEKAGRAIPIKFSLDGNQGRDVFASGYPRSVEVPCGSIVYADGGQPTRSPGRTKLRYKPRRDLYTYLWKTEKSWKGDCRQFVLKLDDGSYHRADFRFR